MRDEPGTVRCIDCGIVIVGMRQPASNWNAITKVIRQDERDLHGGYTEELRDELSRGLRELRSGQVVVAAGRYEIDCS